MHCICIIRPFIPHLSLHLFNRTVTSSLPSTFSSDEQHAQYVDAEGNFYNILGAQFIYGDNLETYGMFTSLEDAAANMRLKKIGEEEIETA